jgi:hypothetical protein
MMQSNVLGGLMSEKISQKQAVVNEVMNVLGTNFDPATPAKQQLTPAHLKTIKDNLVTGITNGTIKYNKDSSNVKEVSSYVPGLLSNHLRKAKELNGGIKYGPKTKKTVNESYSADPTVKLLQEKLETLDAGSPQYQNTMMAIQHAKGFTRRVNKELKPISMDEMPQEVQDLANDLASEIAQ